MLILTYFVVCGVSRLARFNVTASALADEATGKVKYFEGTPIPTSIVIVLMLGIAQYLGHVDDDLWFGSVKIGFALLHPLSLIYGAQRQRHDQRDVADSEALTCLGDPRGAQALGPIIISFRGSLQTAVNSLLGLPSL